MLRKNIYCYKMVSSLVVVIIVSVFLLLAGLFIAYYVNRNKTYYLQFKRETSSDWRAPMPFIGYNVPGDLSSFRWANVSSLGGWLATSGLFPGLAANQSSWTAVPEINTVDWAKAPIKVGYRTGAFYINGVYSPELKIQAEGINYNVRLVPGTYVKS